VTHPGRLAAGAALLILILLACSSRVTLAQAPHDAKLTVTVVDQTGGVLPTATVTVTGQESATAKQTIAPVVASGKGVAVVDGLLPGVYTIQGEMNQFSPSIVKDVRLKSGDNARTIVLTLSTVTQSVTVTEDKQTAASDRSNATFGTTVSTEQVAALAEDPNELQRQLQNMAGPDAVIRVDGFEGAPLPPKSMIKAIHITRDQFAAENHYAGGVFIDIVTQPGIGPAHGGTNINEENGALDGKSPLIPSKGPLNNEYGNFNYGQSLAKNRADFAIAVNQSSSYSTPTIYAATNAGTVAQVLNVQAPTSFLGGNVQFNYALTPDQTLKVYSNMNTSTSSNQGVGGMLLLPHAYSTTSTNKNFRLQEAGPLGRRFFINTRILVGSHGTANSSVLDQPTIVVQGDFTTGGAQMAGSTTQRNALVQSDIDYIRGINTMRFGTQLQGTWYNTNADTNFLGTYSFTSLAAYAANTPALFSQNVGDPVITYQYLEGGVYAQDDIRVRKSLTISAGVRYEVQDHSNEHNNVAPRAGVTWSPFKNGQTTLRASAGIFYDWISNGTYESTLRDDGVRQQQLNIVDPTFPETEPAGGAIPASAVDLLGPNLQLARTTRISAAINQAVGQRVSVGLVYAHTQADHQLSGFNLNAPVNGVLPNPAYTTVVEALSNASTTGYSLQTNVSLALAPPSPDLDKARFNWRRGGMYLYYRYAVSNTDALGAFTLSPTGTLATEWGPSNNDIRHTGDVSVYSNALKNLNVNLFLSAQSGAPYTETTGLEDNNDFLFDLRPEGVGRNTLRMPGQWDLSGSVSYTFGFHKRSTANVPGQVGITYTNGQFSTMTRAADPNRLHVSIGVYAVNITNHPNLVGFSGVMTSPFFMQPTGATNLRTFAFFANFRF
jgi:hypothetical protein